MAKQGHKISFLKILNYTSPPPPKKLRSVPNYDLLLLQDREQVAKYTTENADQPARIRRMIRNLLGRNVGYEVIPKDYTRTNVHKTQVVTGLQTSCYKSVHKLSTSCVRTACSQLL